MLFSVLQKSDVDTLEKIDLYSVPEGTIRLYYSVAEKFGIKRNDITKIVHNGKSIKRRVFLSANMGKDKIVIDYDSIKELGIEDGLKKPFELELKKLRVLSVIRYALKSPNMTDRLSVWLGLMGLITGIIGAFIGIISYLK